MDVNQSLLTDMRFRFLYVDKYLFKEGWVFPENYMPYNMLRYITKGSAVFVIDGTEHVVRKDQVSYIPYGCLLECYSLEEEIEFISIRFAVTAQPEGNDFLREFFHLRYVADVTDPAILHCFEEIYKSATTKSLSRVFHIRGNLELLFARLVDQQEQPKADGEKCIGAAPPHEASFFSKEYLIRRERKCLTIKRDPRIQTVMEYLVAHPEYPMSTVDLCDIAQMSPSSFRRHFKEHTGKSPGEFIKELRMMVVARRLLVTDERISDIAYELGFKDQNYFSRTFKAVFGVSPSQYRKASRA